MHTRAGCTAGEVRQKRKAAGVVPAFKRVDTCAAEFEAATPYMYSSYDGNDECESTTERKVGCTLHSNLTSRLWVTCREPRGGPSLLLSVRHPWTPDLGPNACSCCPGSKR